MTISHARIRCAFLRDKHDLAGLVLHALEQHLDGLAGNRRRLVLPLVQSDQALGLVADIDDDLIADDLDDPARDNAANLEALTSAQDLIERVRAVLRRDQGRQLVFIDIEFAEQITIYHVPVSSLFRPTREASRDGASPQPHLDDRNGTRNHPGSALPSDITSLCDWSTQAIVMEKKRHSSTQGAHEYKLLL